MRTNVRGVYRWSVMVVAWLGAMSPIGIATIDDVSDSILMLDLPYSGGHGQGVYYLGPGSQFGEATLIYSHAEGDDPMTGWFEFWGPNTRAEARGGYRYTVIPPTLNNPAQAELVIERGEMEEGLHLILDLEAGTIDSEGSADGVMTLRSFRLSPPTGAQNLSNRNTLHPGEVSISGFVVHEERWVLIRGIGPSLALFGVENPVPDITITLYNEEWEIATNGQWGLDGPDTVGMQTVFSLAGAFPLEAGTLDSALFVLLEPGAYTVHAESLTSIAPGDSLVEVFILPYE